MNMEIDPCPPGKVFTNGCCVGTPSSDITWASELLTKSDKLILIILIHKLHIYEIIQKTLYSN